MIRFYRNNKKNEKIIEILFEVCLYVVIFLGHKMDKVYITYEYRVFFALMIVFGLWLYNLRSNSMKDTIYDIIIKLLAPFLGALIIAKLTGKIDVMDILPALYVAPIAFIYYLEQKKKIYRINGKEVRITSSQFLKEKIGDYSIIPRVSMYIIILAWFIFNLPIKGFFIMSLFVYYIFNGLYIYIVENFVLNNSRNE